LRTAVLLARSGSRRLPGKALLPWQGFTLFEWCIQQTLLTPDVDGLYVGSDSRVYLELALKYHLKYDKPVIPRLRDRVSDKQSSFDGLREVLCDSHGERLDQHANHALLVQCTSPFINPADLQKLCGVQATAPERGYALSATGQTPSGMGYLIHPAKSPTAWDYIQQAADPCDVDTLPDYCEALQKMPQQPVYGQK
jgi:molybdopterin-guanine dinucleotide biosynthesis protein A